MFKGSFKRVRRLLSRPLTLLLVPPRGAKTKNLSMPFWVAGLCGLLTVIFISGCGWSFYTAWQARSDQEELSTLRQVNKQHQEELVSLRQEAVEAETYLDRVRELDRQVRQKVGLEVEESVQEKDKDSLSSRAGSSTAHTPRTFLTDKSQESQEVSSELSTVMADCEELCQMLEDLTDDVDARYAYLASLPDHWPAQGRITSHFGNRKSPFGGGRTEFHDGLDIAANYGAPICAAGDGLVTFVGYRSGYGNTVVISHRLSGYRTSYCHLTKGLVKSGDQVKKGEKIGLAGSSGRSTGPHLHFIVEKNGDLMNPLDVLK